MAWWERGGLYRDQSNIISLRGKLCGPPSLFYAQSRDAAGDLPGGGGETDIKGKSPGAEMSSGNNHILYLRFGSQWWRREREGGGEWYLVFRFDASRTELKEEGEEGERGWKSTAGRCRFSTESSFLLAQGIVEETQG